MHGVTNRIVVATLTQWRMALLLALGVASAVATVALRQAEVGAIPPAGEALDRAQIGVFTTVDDRVVLGMTPTPEYTALGQRIPEYRFEIDVEPGERAHGRVSLM